MLQLWCKQGQCVCCFRLPTGLSTYLPLRKDPPLVSEANMKTPIFQAHGDADYTASTCEPLVSSR